MYDLLPGLTDFLEAIFLYLTYIGILLAAISFVVAGLAFLPVFGFDERRVAVGITALRMAGIGLAILVLAPAIRTSILHFFPPPSGLPAIPNQLPIVTPPVPTATSTPAGS